eukprot:Pgem_evm1s18881
MLQVYTNKIGDKQEMDMIAEITAQMEQVTTDELSDLLENFTSLSLKKDSELSNL